MSGQYGQSIDYVSPPWLLTVEQDEKERNVVVSEYVPHTEVAEAFGVKRDEPIGVAPAQPAPEGSSGPLWAAFVVMAVAALVLASILSKRPSAGGGEWMMAFVAIGFLIVPRSSRRRVAATSSDCGGRRATTRCRASGRAAAAAAAAATTTTSEGGPVRRSVLWFLVYGTSVLGLYAWGGFRGAWKMRSPSPDSSTGRAATATAAVSAAAAAFEEGNRT